MGKKRGNFSPEKFKIVVTVDASYLGMWTHMVAFRLQKLFVEGCCSSGIYIYPVEYREGFAKMLGRMAG